ncbi:MAG: ABC transporter ATP-binding protein [Planctomycetota bacterium]|jgi:putative ABC transport system ATP-binding protein
MIEMKNISVSYTLRGHTVKALDELSLRVEKGDYVSIIGPSGCGKSTLLQVLGGMLTPDRGEVFMEKKSLFGLPESKRAEIRRERIGFVFQRFNLVGYLTAQENVQIPLLLNLKEKEAQEAKSAELLTRVGLGDRMDHKPSELSVGQQQRVALARMLANDPDIIFADEPTGALDPETAKGVLSFFEEMNQEGRTIVMVTHDPQAARCALRTVRLADGRIAETLENSSEERSVAADAL